MPGSGAMCLLDWRRATPAKEEMDGTTPRNIAAQLKERAIRVLEDVDIARQWKPETVVDQKAKRRSADQPFRK